MKRIYIAGPYSADNVMDVLRNIGRGEYYAALLFKLGFAPFAPWSDKDFIIINWMENFTVQEFYDYSIAWLKVSDGLFVVPNHKGLKDWQDSGGTLKEIQIAKELKIPVFYNIDDLIKWKVVLNIV